MEISHRSLLALMLALLWLFLASAEAAFADTTRPQRLAVTQLAPLPLAAKDVQSGESETETERGTNSSETETETERETNGDETETERETETETGGGAGDDSGTQSPEAEATPFGGSGAKALGKKRGELAVPPRVMAPREVIPVDMGELGQLQRTPAERFLNSVWFVLLALGVGAAYLGVAVIRKLVRGRRGQISEG